MYMNALVTTQRKVKSRAYTQLGFFVFFGGYTGLKTLFIACFLHAIIKHSNEKTFYCLMKWKCGCKE